MGNKTKRFDYCLNPFVLLFLLILPGLLPASFSLSVTPNTISKFNTPFDGGYDVFLANKVTLAQGSFVIPTVSCAATPTGLDDAQYIVGIDSSAGADFGCNSGASFYNPFCIFLTAVGCPGIPAGDKVSPGDRMKVVVTFSYSTHHATVMLKDITKSWAYTHTVTDTASYIPGAIWNIVGGPTDCGCPLPNFGTLKTSGNSVTVGTKHGAIKTFSSVSSVSVHEDTLVDSMGHTLAAPTSLSNTGSAFSIKWVAAT